MAKTRVFRNLRAASAILNHHQDSLPHTLSCGNRAVILLLMPSLRVIVIAPPNARYLKLLEQLPDDTTITTGTTAEAFRSAAPLAESYSRR